MNECLRQDFGLQAVDNYLVGNGIVILFRWNVFCFVVGVFLRFRYDHSVQCRSGVMNEALRLDFWCVSG